MGDVKLIIKQDLFDSVGVTVSKLKCIIGKKNDIWIYGDVSINEKKLDDCAMSVNANLCDEDDRILFVFREYPLISFEEASTESFVMLCVDIARFFDVGMLHHVEIYPRVGE